MKSRPIIFSAPMVVALLAGTKTQTRRILKLPHQWSIPPARFYGGRLNRWGTEPNESIAAPYGVPGDQLWVREAWARTCGQKDHTGRDPDVLWYRADGLARFVEPHSDCFTGDTWEAGTHEADTEVSVASKWMSPLFMPRWASRVTLEITEVRIQRLQQITNDDAKAEGAEASKAVEMKDGSPCYTLPFEATWQRIHGIDNPAAWESNPWVWALTFRRVSP